MSTSRLQLGATLFEVVTVTAIVMVLAAILGAVYGKVKRSAIESQCQSNLSQVGRANLLYAEDNDSALPPYVTVAIAHIYSNGDRGPRSKREPQKWREVLSPYAGSTDLFFCPFDPNKGTTKPDPGNFDGVNSEFTSYGHVPWVAGEITKDGLLSSTVEIELNRGQAAFLQDRGQQVFEPRNLEWLNLSWHGKRGNVWYLNGTVKNISYSEE